MATEGVFSLPGNANAYRQCQFQQLLAASASPWLPSSQLCYNRIKATDAEEKARIEGYFQKWYDKRGNNYEGNQNWRGSTGFRQRFHRRHLLDHGAGLVPDVRRNRRPNLLRCSQTDTGTSAYGPVTSLTQSGWLLPGNGRDLGPDESANGPAASRRTAGPWHSTAAPAGDEEAAQEYIDQACTCSIRTST